MEESFDPYLQWLGIRDKTRPPNHYRLLGIDLFESDADVISSAADRQMAYVRGFQTGQRSDLSQKLLNELAAARLCLLKPQQKAAYDKALNDELNAAQQVLAPPPAAPLRSVMPGNTLSGKRGTIPADVGPVAVATKKATEGDELPFSPNPNATYRRRLAQSNSTLGPAVTVAVILCFVVVAFIVWNGQQNAESSVSQPTVQPGPPKASSGTSQKPSQATASVDSKEPTTPTPNEAPIVPQVVPQVAESPQADDAARNAEAVDMALAEARRQLAMRDPVQARSSLGAVQSNGISREQRTALTRLEQLSNQIQAFWDATSRGLSLLAPGDRLMVNGDLLTVASVGGELITNRMSDGIDQAWSLEREEMNAALAAVVAERAWDAGAGSALATVGAFWAMDRQADRVLARQLWDRAEAEGTRVAVLLPELNVPLPESIVRPPAYGVKVLKSAVDANHGTPAVGRLSPPEAEKLNAALEKVRSTYKQELSAATTEDSKSVLAGALDQRAGSAVGDPAGQFAFWKLAEELAISAGDVQLALAIVGHRGERFDVDTLELQQGIIVDSISKTRDATSMELLLSALSLSTDAVEAERFELATKLTQLVKAQAGRAKNKTIEKEAIVRDRQIKDLQKTYDAAQKAIQRLESEPDNPRDNAAVGRYYCFVKRDWDRGLPMLAKGSEERLAKAATLELAKPASAQARLELADAWWAAGEAPTSPNRLSILQRAQHWYDQAKTELSGLEKSRVERRLTAIAEATAKAQGTSAGELLELSLPQGLKLRLRQIPAGKFTMGSPQSERARKPDETQHAVTISRPFYLGITEVTQAQWMAVTGNNPSTVKGRDLPVEMVSWSDCAQFCQLLNQSRLGTRFQFRLPTEAEWEYACRAGSRTAYCFGELTAELTEYAWCSLNGDQQPHPVAQLKANAWGLYDMHGNVAEWCQDFRRELTVQPQTDPVVLDAGFGRVRRGGTPWEDVSYCRSASRVSNSQEERRRYLGFRIVAVPH